jgi:hypothetical protein
MGLNQGVNRKIKYLPIKDETNTSVIIKMENKTSKINRY